MHMHDAVCMQGTRVSLAECSCLVLLIQISGSLGLHFRFSGVLGIGLVWTLLGLRRENMVYHDTVECLGWMSLAGLGLASRVYSVRLAFQLFHSSGGLS